MAIRTLQKKTACHGPCGASQSARIYESTTVNETYFCRARPLGVPFADSCIPSITAKRRAGVVAPYRLLLFLSNDSRGNEIALSYARKA